MSLNKPRQNKLISSHTWILEVWHPQVAPPFAYYAEKNTHNDNV